MKPALVAIAAAPVLLAALGRKATRVIRRRRCADFCGHAVNADYLVEDQSTDAALWASTLVNVLRAHPDLAADEGCLIGWFACAIENGRAAGRRETCPHTDVLQLDADYALCQTCGEEPNPEPRP